MTDESTSDDQSVRDEQKADFAARAEKVRGVGPRLVDEFVDEVTADRAGTPDNDVHDLEFGVVKGRLNSRRNAWVTSGVAILIAIIACGFGQLKIDPPPQPPSRVDQAMLVELVRTIIGQSSAIGSDQHEDDVRSAVERVLREADAGGAQAKESIEAIRQSGNTDKLLAVLEHEAGQKVATSVDADFMNLCREIAAVAYLRGNLDAALLRVELVLKTSPNDLSGLILRGGIHQHRGELDDAIRCYEFILKLTSSENPSHADALGNLGIVYNARSDLDRAEEMFLMALEIDEEHGRKEGMARHLGNLGNVYLSRGELDRAEKLHLKSLEIEKELGRKVGMAADYGNLGLVYLARDDVDRAEEMHLKSLQINVQLRRRKGMANQYSNLGVIHQRRGELDVAEEMQLKALEVNEELVHRKGMAIQYANLGLIARERGDAVNARRLWTESRDLYEDVGIPHEVDEVQSWLDGLQVSHDGR